MSREEAEHYFRIDNTATEWTMTSILYLEPTKFHAVLRLAYEHGGTYDSKPKGGIIHIPKESVPNPVISEQGIHSEPSHENEKLEEALGHTPPVSKSAPETAEEYALSRSLKGKLGQLVPCLADANGVVFDGLHRKQIDPNAWTVKLDKVKTATDRIEARLQTNFCRRKYSSEEIKEDIVSLVGYGFTAEEIADRNGVSLTTVYKYMPQANKDQVKVEAGKLGGEAKAESSATPAKQTVKTQDTAQPNIATPQFIASAQGYIATELKSCEKCGMPVHRSKMGLVAGKLVCPKCAGIAEPVAKPELPVKEYKPKETGDYRVAQMHPQKSKFELQVIQELQAEGLPLETDREFCVQKTVPDAILKLKDRTIAIYIDSEATHSEGDERDEFLRGSLKKLYGLDVLAVRYKSDSAEARQNAKEQIREFLKW